MEQNAAEASPPSGSDPVAQIVSAAKADELRLLDDAIRSLPPSAVQELLSLGVCFQCVLRFFGIYGPCYSDSTDVLPLFATVSHSSLDTGDMKDGSCPNKISGSEVATQGQLKEAEICHVCYGILQFVYVDDKGKISRYNCAYTFCMSVSKLVKQEGHSLDSFSIEVSIPHIVQDSENTVRLHMKTKFASENWFQEKLNTEDITVKDALKSLITIPLEEMLGVKSGSSSFPVRLTYSCPVGLGKGQNGLDRNQVGKKRKTDWDENRDTSNRKAGGGTKQADISMKEANSVMTRCDNSLHCPDIVKSKVSALCFTCRCHRMPVYVGGRYLKFSRNVSQTRWIIDDERMGEASVEEIIGSSMLPICQGDSYKFHAAGREDIDVRMLGSGRPFLVEIQNARIVPHAELVKEMKAKINRPDQEMVRVKNLKVVDDQGWALMREGEAEKQKQYAALVWVSRPLDDKDFTAISSFQDLRIIQRTPVRVLHRRSPLEREKIIHWMKTEKIAGTSQYFLLHLCTQAGTYIKEFVHGDLGRTHPSIGSILGCRTEILQLDVTDVKMDSF